MTKQFKTHFYKAYSEIESFCHEVLYNKAYLLSIFLFSILSYGFNIFNRTISIDDFSRKYLIGEGKLALRGCRWGQYIWVSLFSTWDLSPFIDRFFSLIFLVLSAIMICVLLHKLLKTNNVWPYTIFSSLYITYSLNNEIWEYTGAGMLIWGGILLSAFVILYLINIEKPNIIDIVFVSLLLTLAVSSYESSVFVYVTMVAFSSLIKHLFIDEHDFSWVKKCLVFIIPLVISVVLKYAIGYLLIKINGLTYLANGDTQLNWFKYGFVSSLQEIYNDFLCYYVYNAKYYAPIQLFILSSLLFAYVFIRKCNSISKAILAVLSYLSIFLLSFIKGDNLSYRYAQTIQYFIAIVGCLITYLSLSSRNKKNYKHIICILLFMVISLRQGITCNQLLALNNQRSENEANVIRYIGNKLYSEYEISKKVIFCGQYHLGNNIQSQISPNGDVNNGEFVDTNVNSCIKWAIKVSDKQARIKQYFSYYGYDINVAGIEFSNQINKEYEKIAIENGMNPLSIKDMGDYILVYFGKIDD